MTTRWTLYGRGGNVMVIGVYCGAGVSGHATFPTSREAREWAAAEVVVV